MSGVIRSRATAAPSMDPAVAWSLAASGSAVLPTPSQPVVRYAPRSSPPLPPPAAPSAASSPSPVSALSRHKFKRLLASIDTSDAPALHLYDGAVGAHRHFGTPVRVIATDESAITLARSILHPVSTQRDPLCHADPSAPVVYLADGGPAAEKMILASHGREGIASASGLTSDKLKSVLLSVARSSPATTILPGASHDPKTGLVVLAVTDQSASIVWNADATVSPAFREAAAAATGSHASTPRALLAQLDAGGRSAVAAESRRQRALVLSLAVGGQGWTAVADSGVKVWLGGKAVTAEKAAAAKIGKMSAAVEKALAAELLAKAGPRAMNDVDAYAAEQ